MGSEFNKLESEYAYKTEVDAYVPRRIVPSISSAAACSREVDVFAYLLGWLFLV